MQQYDVWNSITH